MAYTRVCKKCLLEKPLNEFRARNNNKYYRHTCKECEKKYHYDYIKDNKDKMKDIRKKYYENNKEKLLNKDHIYYQKNKDIINEKRKNKRQENKEEFNKMARIRCKKNRKKISERENIRFHNDNLYKIKKQVRRDSFQKKGFRKKCKTVEILGCTFDYFYDYLLKTFKDNYGYEWDKKEPIHIDHKKPLKYAKTKEEVIELCHYTNLQLLKAEDNLLKGSKLNYKIKKEEILYVYKS